MFWNYLKIALRNLRRQKLHSFINIFGLAVGLAATFLIFTFVRHELTYDKFNKDAEHIYRYIVTMSRPDNQEYVYPININKVGPQVKDRFPQVDNYLRIKPARDSYVNYEQERYTGISTLYADSTFFRMFDYRLVQGSPEQVLTDPQSAVLTRKLANKIFQGKDPVGHYIQVAQKKYLVKGIMNNFPSNSHIRYDMILSLQGYPGFETMGSLEYATYIKMDPEHDDARVREKIIGFSDKLVTERFKESGYTTESRLQRLTDIHLKSGTLQFDYITGGDIRRVFMYSFLALIILIVAIINYLNLFTARAEYRTREVGLRKVMGAFRKDLMKQFLGESILTTCIALIIALAIVELTVDDFGRLLSREFSTAYLQKPFNLLFILGITGMVGLLAGYYPAFYLSKFNVIRIFRGGRKTSKGKGMLNVSLVVVQFVIAIFLISSVIIFNRQIRFMKNKDKGFNEEHVVVVRGLSEPLKKSYHVVRDQLLNNPGIEYVSSSQSVPGITERSGQTVWKKGDSKSSGIAIKENRVNIGYVETMGLQLKEGRSFSQEYGNEENSFIINDKARKMLGLEKPIGAKLEMGFMEGTIIGVVEDYHYNSLKYEVDPLILTNYNSKRNKTFYSMRIKPVNISQKLDHVEKVMQNVDSEYSLNYVFLDDQFDRVYKSEERSSKLVGFATILAIVIAFLGIFALTSFSILKRTKEIGVRKALGASQANIVRLFNAGMLRWIGVASLIAFPLVWYFMNQWLQNFSYRIDLQPWILLVSASGAALIALLTTSTLTVKAANVNPAETLRDE